MELSEAARQWSGDGSGYGYWDGSGYGGYWDGSGDGSGDGWRQIAESIGGSGALFWRSDADGKPFNGGSGPAVYPGLVQECDSVSICSRGFHATSRPDNWSGDRWWIVRVEGDLQTEDDKVCGRKRTIIAEFKGDQPKVEAPRSEEGR